MSILDWFRRKDALPDQAVSLEPTESAPGQVFARLTDSTIRIVLFPGYGQADGGIPYEVPIEVVPPDCRTPNTKLEVVLERATKRVLAVKRQNPDMEFFNGKFVPKGSHR
jgi:hypothetical protein